MHAGLLVLLWDRMTLSALRMAVDEPGRRSCRFQVIAKPGARAVVADFEVL
jgi:hypothetical protein